MEIVLADSSCCLRSCGVCGAAAGDSWAESAPSGVTRRARRYGAFDAADAGGYDGLAAATGISHDAGGRRSVRSGALSAAPVSQGDLELPQPRAALVVFKILKSNTLVKDAVGTPW